ncbi:FtsX-like permease family protein, partial [Phaeobacter sp. HF9A]|uniref:FtsX-like permease family protein n=1 Tax=Phaeobacter sp. HF9A TaxID=2721561 RepID=UPI00142F6CE1
LALATALWSAVQAINAEARVSYQRAMTQLGTGSLAALSATEGTIPEETYVRLRRAGWQLSPVLEGAWQLGPRPVSLLGVDVLSYPGATAMAERATTGGLDPLQAMQPPGLLFAHPDLVAELSQGGFQVMDLPELPPNVVLGDISLVQRMLRQPGQLSRLIILEEQPLGLPPIADLAPELRQSTASTGALGAPERLTRSFHLNLTAFGLLSFAVGLFIVQGSVTLGIEQRRGMVRVLRQLGVPLSQLMAALIAELLLLALLGGGLGLVLGYALAGILLPDVSATLRGLYGADVAGSLSLRPIWVLSGLGMAMAGTLLAGVQALLSLRQTARSLSQAPNAQSRKWGLRRGVWVGAGLFLGVGGWACLLLWPGLIAGFICLGGLMLGAALLLPPIFQTVISGLMRLTSAPLLRWLLADSRLQLPGLSLSLMALLLAVATNVGVGTMVSSFRLTFLGWIDQRLAAELYVRGDTPAQTEAVLRWAEQNNIRALPQFHGQTGGGAPLELAGVVDDPLYAQTWPLLQALPDAWQKLHAREGVLINEQLAHREVLGPGDRVLLTPDWRAEILGIYSDYGNVDGQAMVSAPALRAHLAHTRLSRVGLISPEGQSPAELAAVLQRALSLPGDAIQQRDRIVAASVAIFDRTFVVTGALNILTLGVAGFAMLTSFLGQWSRHLPQLAPIWAMGVSRRQLARFEMLRSLALALATFLLALPLGLLLAWVLLNVINLEAFGWRLPMFLFPLDWLQLFALTMGTAVLAALLPVIRLLRLAPATLLGVFSNET